MNLEGRVAIVTGGAGGLGSATVQRLIDAGMKVVVFDIAGDRAVELAKTYGDAAAGVGGDAMDDEDAGAAIDTARSLGALSLVANIAGGGAGGGRTVSRDGAPVAKDGFVKTLEMNVVATFNMSRLAAAAMSQNEPNEEGERGVIVNTASIAGLEGQTGQLGYAAAKAAILGMTLPMARDLSPVGIRVCAIAPGTMGTPIMMTMPEAMRDKLIEGIQFPHRLGKPEEFAELVESIARNPYLNGENIRLDGALRFPPK
jgi:NAD(P)-dependent dehydrogenase (short-subunit alcohol dehydrogenase family)